MGTCGGNSRKPPTKMKKLFIFCFVFSFLLFPLRLPADFAVNSIQVNNQSSSGASWYLVLFDFDGYPYAYYDSRRCLPGETIGHYFASGSAYGVVTIDFFTGGNNGDVGAAVTLTPNATSGYMVILQGPDRLGHYTAFLEDNDSVGTTPANVNEPSQRDYTNVVNSYQFLLSNTNILTPESAAAVPGEALIEASGVAGFAGVSNAVFSAVAGVPTPTAGWGDLMIGDAQLGGTIHFASLLDGTVLEQPFSGFSVQPEIITWTSFSMRVLIRLLLLWAFLFVAFWSYWIEVEEAMQSTLTINAFPVNIEVAGNSVGAQNSFVRATMMIGVVCAIAFIPSSLIALATTIWAAVSGIIADAPSTAAEWIGSGGLSPLVGIPGVSDVFYYLNTWIPIVQWLAIAINWLVARWLMGQSVMLAQMFMKGYGA